MLSLAPAKFELYMVLPSAERALPVAEAARLGLLSFTGNHQHFRYDVDKTNGEKAPVQHTLAQTNNPLRSAVSSPSKTTK
ncbi:hypothetical protein M514_13364 [Trichuris suis]|uniref:Uncharacterized protein n=1 Tax=Trichuris suis TaxID=68888 RepID=A0A085NCG0_9BILA|nr:hypothetical protein M514_13364 [Trichuris suis]